MNIKSIPGILIQTMDDMLLRKIEELTLYVIEQNNELKAQNEKLKAQGEKLKAMEEENEKLKARNKEIDELKLMMKELVVQKKTK